MGRGRKDRRKVAAKHAVSLRLVEPTPEQLAKGVFAQGGHYATGLHDRNGLAFRRTPVIDTLFNAGQITAREYDMLAHYRNQALQAEDDVAAESTLAPARIMGGGGSVAGSRIPASLVFTPAVVETGRIERDLGPLLDIARAIAVEDKSLTQWCIEKHGGRERYDGKGRFVAIVPICEKRNVGYARLELKSAAGKITR